MADEKDIAGEEQAPGGKKKLIIIIAAVVVLLLVGGGAAFFLLGGEEEGEETAATEEAGEAPAAEEGPALYHKLDPPFVVNLPPGGHAGMLQIAIEIRTHHQSVVDTLTTNDPMIRHNLLNLLEEQQADALLKPEGVTALQEAVQTNLGEQLKELKEPGEIKGVYFTRFVMQ